MKEWICEYCKYRKLMSTDWCENPAAVSERKNMRADATECDFYRQIVPKKTFIEKLRSFYTGKEDDL